MSSRSLAAARSRRAGENAPPVSGNRPGTSIGSHAAFAPQGYQTQMPGPPPNVRTARGPPQQQYQQQQNSQRAAYQQVQQSQQQSQSSLPFSKLSFSDAIGLITLRLGRVEQWVIETEHENQNAHENETSEHSNLPENSKIVDNSVFSSIINRLEAVEKKESETVNNEEVTKLSEDVTKLNDQLAKIIDEGVKHNLAISKHTEQLFRFERELVETKDILKTFMIKYDLFAADTNNKFTDYEFALSELEKNIQPLADPISEVNEKELEGTSINDIDSNENEHENANSIMSVDLKNIIKQELASSS
jgi:hypothetical protein